MSYLHTLLKLSESQSISQKINSIQGAVDYLEKLHDQTMGDVTSQTWSSIVSIFSLMGCAACIPSLPPILGFGLMGGAVASTIASVTTAAQAYPETKMKDEKVALFLGVLKSNSPKQWAHLWEESPDTTAFLMGIERAASNGYIDTYGNFQYYGANTRHPFDVAREWAIASVDEVQSLPLSQRRTETPVIGSNTKLTAVEVPAIDAAKTDVVNPIPQKLPEPPVQNQPKVTLNELLALPLDQRAIAIIDQLAADGFDISRCIQEQITCICGNQRGGKGTLMAILAILTSAIDPTTRIHYFTAGDDIYPFKCDRLVCRLSYPHLDGQQADEAVAAALYQYLEEMDNKSQGTCNDIILVIDEAVALSDYLSADQKQWMIRFLLTRANKKGAQIFVVLHGSNLTSWVGTGNAGGYSATFKSGASFVGCESTSRKINKLRSISVATGHYFLAEPDDFSKPLDKGDLGHIPDWLKYEINPSSGQPDPARTLLKLLPELYQEPVKSSPTTDDEEWHVSLPSPSEKPEVKKLEDMFNAPSAKEVEVEKENPDLSTEEGQVQLAVELVEEYLFDKGLESEIIRKVYGTKNRLRTVFKTQGNFERVVQLAARQEKLAYIVEGKERRVGFSDIA